MTYRSFDTGTWQDPWFENLKPYAKLLFIYLWTNDITNQAGCYHISQRRIEFEVGFKVDSTIAELNPKVFWDQEREIVWVKNFCKRQCANSHFFIGALNAMEKFPIELRVTFCNYNNDLFIKYGIDKPEYPEYTDPIPTVNGPYTHPLSDQIRSDQFRDILSSKKLDPAPSENSQPPYKAIIEYLNFKSAKNFNSNAKETRRLIKARWQAGYREDDFQQVIDFKCQKWLTDPKMVDFVRPQTLFGSKFEAYLNEKPANHKTKQEKLICNTCGKPKNVILSDGICMDCKQKEDHGHPLA